MKQSVIIVCNNLAFHTKTSNTAPAAPDMRKDEYEFHIRALIPVSLRYTRIHINGSFLSHVVMSLFSNNVRRAHISTVESSYRDFGLHSDVLFTTADKEGSVIGCS